MTPDEQYCFQLKNPSLTDWSSEELGLGLGLGLGLAFGLGLG